MEADRSIILQKKMIVFLSAIVIGIFSSVLYIEKNEKNKRKVYAQNIELITVNVGEDENEILRSKVRYLAVKTIPKISESGEKKSFVEDIVSNEDLVAVENMQEGAIISSEETFSDTIIGEVQVENEYEFLKNKVQNEEQIANDAADNVLETNGVKLVKYKDLAENNPPAEYSQKIEVTATAYCLCQKCCGKSPENPNYGNTHSGLKIVPGSGIKVIAVDPSVIPLNTKVYVEGLNEAWDYGYAIAADTGSAIKELKIDLYMDTHTEALEWGRRKVNVYLLAE